MPFVSLKGPIHTSTEEFLKRHFTLTKQIIVFVPHYKGEIENAITGHFEFVFEDSVGDLIVTLKLRFQNPFRPASVFKVLGFE